jgi:hypothetical protein
MTGRQPPGRAEREVTTEYSTCTVRSKVTFTVTAPIATWRDREPWLLRALAKSGTHLKALGVGFGVQSTQAGTETERHPAGVVSANKRFINAVLLAKCSATPGGIRSPTKFFMLPFHHGMPIRHDCSGLRSEYSFSSLRDKSPVPGSVWTNLTKRLRACGPGGGGAQGGWRGNRQQAAEPRHGERK